MSGDYKAFIESKRVDSKSYGFDVSLNSLNRKLKNWQKRAVQWFLKRGRAAAFERVA